MKTNLLLATFLAVSLLLTGCVSTKKHTALQTDYNTLNQRYQQSQIELAENKTKIRSLEDQLAQERANNAALRKSLDDLRNTLDKSINQGMQGNVNISKLVDEINASNKYIQHLVNEKNRSDSLNLVLVNNLTRSLSTNELRDVDVKVLKGVVYISLADNMLYKTGSYEISERAGDILGKIAKIIMDHDKYDVLVEGNTDNVPISRTNIRNNWDLSALRASSVVQALQNKYGVNPSRMTAGGRGEYNPVADNNTEAGKAMNRRTQIIITPKLNEFMELIGQPPAASSVDL
ncbi:flagellar motor protein MotB [Haoranjiania flava]|uniref:OmpA family protein n=1 Tax=Haoranjiania flava TaxID=1856322 RepID=A0AAE3IQ31_9BACT|nr:OmpA family protein [Haoranjiania flava]MCU7694351.1 OmpA family protein [Haoranjiania flava]